MWGEVPLETEAAPFHSALSLLADPEYGAALSERLIVLTSPSKCFNVASLDIAAAVIPNDTVRRRLQMQGKGGRPKEYHNMFDGLYKLARDEGPAELYRGLRPACLEKMPSTAITFFAYEVLKGLLGLKSV